jgi:hypothetical protein
MYQQQLLKTYPVYELLLATLRLLLLTNIAYHINAKFHSEQTAKVFSIVIFPQGYMVYAVPLLNLQSI